MPNYVDVPGEVNVSEILRLWTHAKSLDLVAGVFVGSALWRVLLSGGVGLFRARVTVGWMRAVNRLSGAAITAFGIYSLATLRAP